MKNRLMITISSVDGSKQYTLHQFITVIAKWLILGVIIVLIGGSFYLHYLFKKTEEAKGQMQQAQALIISLGEQQIALQKRISNKSQELGSMDAHLKEIEEILGLDTQLDDTPTNRAEHIRTKALSAIKKMEQTKVSKNLTSTLNRYIPTGKPINYRKITSKFGYRNHPITKKRSFHAGLDLSAPMHTPIYATADGVIEYAGKKGGYGNYILIDHPLGFKTAYGHLNNFQVKKGDYIHKHDIIGYVGNTGRSTGPHLHYEILYLHSWLNPIHYIHFNGDDYTTLIKEDQRVNWYGLTHYLEESL
jgi:murein DD-endopeptidase MepM/ murein hydrolase activator NlpD